MKKTNILITGTGGGGVGEGVFKALLNIQSYNLYCTNNSRNSLFVNDFPSRSFIVPTASQHNYCEVLLDLCKNHSIQVLIPGSEPELVVLTKNRNLFLKEGVIVLSNSDEVIDTFDNKWFTFLKLSQLGINTPDTIIDENDHSFFHRNSFPYIVKPIVGNASKNVFVVNNQEELTCIVKYFNLKSIPYVIQQFIGTMNEEYTISVLSDFEGNYLGSIILKRLLSGGYSQFVECDEFPMIEEEAINVSKLIHSTGPLNIQCRLENGKLNIFEINPRFSGTTPFRALMGFNEVETLIEKEIFGRNIFNKSDLKFEHFGVRGFVERIYQNKI